MSDTVNSTELDGQHVELLPARTVLSMFSAGSDSPIPGGGIGGIVNQVTGLPSMSSGADGSNTEGAAGANKS